VCAGTPVTLPAITEKDKQDLIFGVQQGVDLIAASFVRKADDVKEIRKVCIILFLSKEYRFSFYHSLSSASKATNLSFWCMHLVVIC